MPATGNSEAGFTLLEMLVVLAIIGLTSGLAWPAVRHAQAAADFAADVATVEGAVRTARSRAIATGAAQAVAPGKLAGGSRLTGPAAPIVFYPDGSARGGTLTVAGGGREQRLTVARDTGELDLAR